VNGPGLSLNRLKQSTSPDSCRCRVLLDGLKQFTPSSCDVPERVDVRRTNGSSSGSSEVVSSSSLS